MISYFSTPPIPASTFITTLFGQLDSSHQNPHQGVDFGVIVGTPIVAPADGVVSRIFADTGGGGNCLELNHGDTKTMYMHLSSYLCSVGDTVSEGDEVALSGGAAGAPGAGDSTGPHLHFEVRDLANNKYNPMDYLTGTWALSSNLAKLVGMATIDGGAIDITTMALYGGAGIFLFWLILSR